MFRRRWSGLPADPVYPADLKELGYFINEIDEIRSIDDSDYYFKYFLTKNDRWNECHRFAFNQAVIKEIHTRLTTKHNLTTIPLPIGTPPTEPHVPILTSPNLPTASRVVLLFGESAQSLGVLAHRVVGGPGGITRGSVLGLLDALQTQQSSASDPRPPAVVLANAGELWWWPEGGRGLTPVERHRVPMASAVHMGRYHDPRVNEVPGNRTVMEHVRGVFESVVLGGLVGEGAKVDVIALGDTGEDVEGYLDDDEAWERVGGKLNCLVVMGGFYNSKNIKCEGFKRFMKERARAYMLSHTPLDTLIAGPGGNPGAAGFTSYGCPVLSAGEAQLTETMLIETQSAVLSWIQEVALQGEAYKNEVVEIFGEEGGSMSTEEPYPTWGPPETDAAEDKGKGKAKEDTKEDTEDTKTPDGTVKNDGGEAQTNQNVDKLDSNKAMASGQAVEAKKDDKVEVMKAETNGNIPTLPPASDGPEAKDMKDLVEEIRDLTIDD